MATDGSCTARVRGPPPGLPAEPDTFIGRERDLAGLRELLRTARAVTLCAPGGMGKTRLAVRLALESADDYAKLGFTSRTQVATWALRRAEG